MTTQTKPNELRLTRFYDAPVSAVWDAWTDPKQVEKWWGPRGFTLTTHSKDLKTGGHWNYTMHGPDGKDWENRTKYLEVVTHKKLVYDHGANEQQGPLFRVTVFFKEKNSGTEMDMTMTMPTPDGATQMHKFIKDAGGNATWDRLAEHLEKKASNKEVFVINRAFETSIDVMFEMWTDPAHFSKWLAPTGFSMKFLKADIKTGGDTQYSMNSDNGSMTMYGRAHYLKIEKPHLIQYTQQFSDEKGNVSRHPLAPTWPETMLTTVLLTEETPNRTRVTVKWEVFGKATPEELDTFTNARAGMTGGWTGSFDKLESLLATLG